MKGLVETVYVLGVLLVCAAAWPVTGAYASKDQSRLPGMEDGDGTKPVKPFGNLSPLAPQPGENDAGNAPAGKGGEEPGEEGPTATMGVLNEVKQVKLDEDLSKRALDAFIKLKENYQDTDIAEYETLEQFVAEAGQGKALEKDIKSFGFKTVGEWNNTIMSVSFAYAAVVGNQDADIRKEIESIRSDEVLDKELKKSLISGLESMLASEENKTVIRKLNEQPNWAKKLKMLADEEEGGAEH